VLNIYFGQKTTHYNNDTVQYKSICDSKGTRYDSTCDS
jgi:hypothetical protein